MKEDRILTEQEINQALEERHTPEIQRKIKAARVAVAGLGGLGSNIAVMLARLGVGTLHLVDFDRVDPGNLNRQMYRMKDLGQYKTLALTEIIKEINPYLNIKTDTMKINRDNAASVFSGERIICEAFDRAQNKAMLVNTLLEELPEAILVSGSGMAGYGDSNEIRTRKKLSRLYLCGDEASGIERGNCLMAPRVAICAGHQANMVLRLILGDGKDS